MLYDVLGRTVVRYSIAALERLAENSRGVAVKDATGDVQSALRVIDNGDVVGAQAVFLPVWPVIDLICGSGSEPLRCKLTLALLGVIPPAAMRLPQVAADELEIAQVRQAVITARDAPRPRTGMTGPQHHVSEGWRGAVARFPGPGGM